MAVLLATLFTFCFVFALVGLLMTFFPSAAFRRISVPIRFVLSVLFFVLLVTVFVLPQKFGDSLVVEP